MLEKIRAYVPYNEQEQADKEEILRRLGQGGDLYTREDASAHMTASAWVVSPDRSKVLLCYHNLYDSWSWLGGGTAMESMTFCRRLCERPRKKAVCRKCVL